MQLFCFNAEQRFQLSHAFRIHLAAHHKAELAVLLGRDSIHNPFLGNFLEFQARVTMVHSTHQQKYSFLMVLAERPITIIRNLTAIRNAGGWVGVAELLRRLEAVLIDLQRPDLRLQSSSGNPEFGSSARRSENPSLSYAQGRLNHLFFLDN